MEMKQNMAKLIFEQLCMTSLSFFSKKLQQSKYFFYALTIYFPYIFCKYC